jgi:D-serine deaminase-like pyridoxal phosphate-dependent protein
MRGPDKGMPGVGSPGDLLGLRVFTDLPSPVMVLKREALEQNIAAMADYCADSGILLAPHGKTTMSPQIIQRQLAAGAWAVTAATGIQVRAYRSFGVRRILLANELVDPVSISWIAGELVAHPEFEFYCYVDSIAGADLLARTLSSAPSSTRIGVLVELGHNGGRTGCRSVTEALAVARAVAASDRLRLAGVAGYEGSVGHDRAAETLAAVTAFCDTIGHAATAIDGEGLFEGAAEFVILTAGGSVYYDVVTEQLAGLRLPRRPARLVLRCGSYVTHDHGLYARISPFAQPGSRWTLQPALEIWGRVLSCPGSGIAYADFGRRDVPFDQDLPIPLTVRNSTGADARDATGITVTSLNDQHAFLAVPERDPLVPGDWLGCGISHPCTAFDKWRAVPVIDRDYRVVDAVTTYF